VACSKPSLPPDCYLTAEAKINGIPGIVLLDTGSGLTIISSRHWAIIGDKSLPVQPYDGPDIHGPDGSSIKPDGYVTTTIALAGIILQHRAILARNLDHFVLLGNDFMKSIGLVLDIRGNKMWLSDHPHKRYDISSDLTHVDRIDVPLFSIERRVIPPYHIAYIQFKIPSTLPSDSWHTSVTDTRRHILAANSLICRRDQLRPNVSRIRLPGSPM
jgi:hypothetical protein